MIQVMSKVIFTMCQILGMTKGFNTVHKTSNSSEFLMSKDGSVYKVTLEHVSDIDNKLNDDEVGQTLYNISDEIL